MKFSEVLHFMSICSVQLTLLEMIEELTIFAEQQRGLNFADILRTLASYCLIEGEKELDQNASWSIVAHLLLSAAEKLDELYESEPTPMVSLSLGATRLICECFRRAVLLNMVVMWTRSLEEERCRFADILLALADYAEAEADKNPKATHLWRVVAAIIRSASEESSRNGQELP